MKGMRRSAWRSVWMVLCVWALSACAVESDDSAEAVEGVERSVVAANPESRAPEEVRQSPRDVVREAAASPTRALEVDTRRFPGADADSVAGHRSASSAVTGASGSLSWDVASKLGASGWAASQIKLDVQGADGLHVTRVFEKGAALTLTDALPDGQYSWRAVMTPELDAEVQAQLREARLAGSPSKARAAVEALRRQGRVPTLAQAAAHVQTGYFSLREGKVVTDDLVEAR